MNEDKRIFYIDFSTIRITYPSDISRNINRFGVLEQYRDKTYTLKEINAIVAELVTKVPYIPGSMSLKLNVIGVGYHHMLVFKNYDYKEQKRVKQPDIQYLY